MGFTARERKFSFFQLLKQKVWDPIRAYGCSCGNWAAQFMMGLLYENGVPSLTRFISIIAFLAFLAGTAYLILEGRVWAHYDTFAMLTGGGGAATQIANKIVNSVYNSTTGQFPDKKGGQNNG